MWLLKALYGLLMLLPQVQTKNSAIKRELKIFSNCIRVFIFVIRILVFVTS